VTAAASVFLVVDFFLHVGELAQYDPELESVMGYFAFKVPRVVSQVYPAAMLFAVLIGVGTLTEQNEVLAMKICGIGARRVMVPLVLAATGLSLVLLAWNETVVPPASGRSRMILDVKIRKRLQTGVLNATSIWLQTEQGFLNIDYFDATTNVLHGITLHEMDEDFRVRRVVEVRRGTWSGSTWRFHRGVATVFPTESDAVVSDVVPDYLRLDAGPEELRSKRRRAYEFSYGDLRRQVRSLQRKGIDAREYIVDLQFKLASPFSGVMSVMLGVPLALRSRRADRGILRNVTTGLVISFAYWSVTALSVAAGHAGTLPPLLAAWGSNALVIAGAAAAYSTSES
jgi:lipopolysaccharide export system permease protein